MAVITSYTARVFDALSGGNELTGSACTVNVPDPVNPPTLSCTLGGSLTPGTSYFVDVRAANARGTGAASSPRVEVIPRTTPGTPGSLVPSYPASGQVAANWSAATTGGAPTADMNYTMRVWSNNTRTGSPVKECTTPILTCGVSGLVNGTTYYADVIASNGFTGTPSALVAVTPRTTPGTPTNVTGEYPSAGVAAMRWQAPASDGGSPITGYTARVWTASTGGTELTASNCSTTGATTFTCTLQGTLTVGTTYYVALEASNVAGTGTPSARAAVTPRNLPGAPTNVSVTAPTTAATLAVTWTAPTNTGGVPLTGYRARAYTSSTGTTVAGFCTAAPGTTTCTITSGLASRTRYYVAVRAENPLLGPDSTRFTAPNTR